MFHKHQSSLLISFYSFFNTNLQEAEKRHRNTYFCTSNLILGLQLLSVFDETNEEGRLFHIGKILGKKEFFKASL